MSTSIHPSQLPENLGKSEQELQPLIKRWEQERIKAATTDRLIQMRKDLQLITEAGIPCGDLNVDHDGFVVFEIAWAIREDPEVSKRSNDNDPDDAVNVVCRFSIAEKAALRARVAKVTLFKDIQQRVSRVTAVRFTE